LTALWEEVASWRWPVVAFESPQRLPATLRSLAAAAPSREVAVCRELTKRFEEVVRGPATEVAARFAEPPKGEITLVLGPGVAPDDSADVDAALAAVGELVAAGTPRRVAADVVSRLTGVARNRLYRGSL
jgi:16S rRNA (cytidine1402-2'-O)-methyltransferase